MDTAVIKYAGKKLCPKNGSGSMQVREFASRSLISSFHPSKPTSAAASSANALQEDSDEDDTPTDYQGLNVSPKSQTEGGDKTIIKQNNFKSPGEHEFVPLASRTAARSETKLASLERELEAVTAELAEAHNRDEAKKKRIAGSAAAERRVNAWTQWGKLREVVVGVADHGCFIPPTAGEQPAVNIEGGSGATVHKGSGAGKIIAEELPWPTGKKKQDTIDAANAQLNGLATTLEARGVRVLRPDGTIDWAQPLKTPFFEVPHQYCSTCGRDSLITLGNIMLEAAMSRRDRHFEVLAYRDIIGEMRSIDPDCLWKAAPRPTLRDSHYNEAWWDLSDDERYASMHEFEFCVTEDEPLFDAADITRCGKDIFVQVSKTCNNAGIHWLKQELAPHGFRVHKVRFPYDLAPSHLDCTFVPLRPGLVLTNPERPILDEDAEIFRNNGWRFVDAPLPKNAERPWASQSSKWLSMNVLVIGPNEVVCEAEETPLHQVLADEGFEVIPVPFRDVYEFGGGLHCATWDITRDDAMEDFFPIQ